MSRHNLIHRREFWCDTCQMKEPMDTSTLKNHLKEKHGLDGSVTGRKKAVSFLDMEAGQYQNNFEWTLGGGVKVIEVSSGTKP